MLIKDLETLRKQIRQKCIFPIISFKPKEEKWVALGTGFFIHPSGVFLTARHLFYDEELDQETLYGLHELLSGKRVLRPVLPRSLYITENIDSDIAIGILGNRRLKGGKEIPVEEALYLDLNQSNAFLIDLDVEHFGFPNSTVRYTDLGDSILKFSGKWHCGKVDRYHKDKFGLVRNDCYLTSMVIDGGGSGGPLLLGHKAFGVLSSSIKYDDNEGYSTFTPIEYISDILKFSLDGDPLPGYFKIKTISELREIY